VTLDILYRPRREKAPHKRGLSCAYLPRPEPGPVGVSVDPLGDGLGPRVLPEGFMVLPGAGVFVVVIPDPVVVPVVGEPGVVPLIVALPAAPEEPVALPGVPPT
jgi:hypothetical protein